MQQFWHISEEEPFEVSERAFAGEKNIYIQSENAFIFLCLEGEAKIEVDLWRYTLEPNSQLVLLPNAVLQVHQASPNFRLLCIACLGSCFMSYQTVWSRPSSAISKRNLAYSSTSGKSR